MSEPLSVPSVTIPRLDRALRSLIAPLVAYAITLATSALFTGLILVAFAIESDVADEVGGDDLDLAALGNLIGMPFQLAAMGLFGSLGFGDGDLSVSLFAPPLLLTAVFAVATYVVARRLERADPTSDTSERVVLGLASGLGAAVIVSILTRALAMRDDGDVMHATSVGLFFGCLLVTAVASHLGRQSVRGSVWPRWVSREARVAAHLVCQHLLLWVVVLVPVGAIWALVEDGASSGLLFLVWGATASLYAYSMGHVAGVTFFGDIAFPWELGAVTCTVLIALALVLGLLVAVAWRLRRDSSPTWLATPQSWLVLPCAFGALGFVVWLFAAVRVSGEYADVGGGLTLQPSGWLLLVMFAWGAAIELSSRTVASAVATRIPSRLRDRLSAAPRALLAPTPADAQPVAARAPMTPEERRRAKRIGLAVATGGVLIAAGWIAVAVVNSQFYGPEKEAEAYLDAVSKADLDEALDLGPVDDEAEADLLRSELYAESEDRITGYEITDVEVDGRTATVQVQLEGVPGDQDVELTLRKDGRRAVLFDSWTVSDGGLARQISVAVPESTTQLGVNGVTVAVDAGEDVTFWAMPGTYVVDPFVGNRWVASSGDESQVTVQDDTFTYIELPEPVPSDELVEAVESKLKTWVETCMASTELEPDGCPQSAYASGDKPRKVKWTLSTMPTLDFDYFDGTFPAELSSDDSGEATVTYEADQSYGFGAPDFQAEEDSSSFSVSATVDVEGDDLVIEFDSY